MKKRFFLLGAILVILCQTLHAQINEMLFQGFESGETVNYAVTPSTGSVVTTTRSMGGQRSLMLKQLKNDEVELILDTFDFTQNLTLRYISLEFDHICHVPVNSSSDVEMGMIYYKRANQTLWTPVTSQEYNISGGAGTYSVEYRNTGTFNMKAYSEWNDSSLVPNNTHWRSERFDLDNALPSSVAANERKLIIKFVLKRRTLNGNADTNRIGWWIDNLNVKASADRMVSPSITMITFPHGGVMPSSRGARVALYAETSLTAGINSDSVYLVYRVGSDPTEHRLTATRYTEDSPVFGTRVLYQARLPFPGYDTTMQFYCVVRDSTGNANRGTYPKAVDSWVTYHHTRGVEQAGVRTTGLTGTSNEQWFPFPPRAAHRCEFVYDSALLAEAGYGPGAMTSLRFMVASNTTLQSRPKFQVRMKNLETDYVADPSVWQRAFTTMASFMQVVYDSTLTIPVLSSGLEQTINFQDTFYYAGKHLLMQIIYSGTSDPSACNIKMIPTLDSLQSIYFYGGGAETGADAYTSSQFNKSNRTESTRPAFVFRQYNNQPLEYDAGISELVSPNYDVPMVSHPGSLTVKLKNYGANTFEGVRISYRIDDTISGYYDWTGSLNGSEVHGAGAETEVMISQNIMLPAGFHTLCVWVEDTLTATGHNYRDHEPYNDTLCSQFVVCDGPMGGVRNIGGSNPHFNTIEEFLFSLSRCGVNDSLIVRLAPGSYPAFTMPQVDGVSENHYIVFESMDTTRATLYKDNTMPQSAIVSINATSHVRFRNLNFVRRSGSLTDMVVLGSTSSDCRFERCLFVDSVPNPAASMRIEQMLNTAFANNMLVDSCTFVGGNRGVKIHAASSESRSSGVVVRNCLFRNQYINAVAAENQTNLTIEDNEMYDVLTNSSYLVQLTDCYGNLSLQRNRIYTSHGAGGIGMSSITGTATEHAWVVNNMVVCNDDGTTNQQLTPLNIIGGNNIGVYYNSVQMTAPTRVNVSTATFGGGGIYECSFVNNIIVTYDPMNYAFSYQPQGNQTNIVSNNIYYSESPTLNRRGTTSYATIEAWQTAVPEDSLSISVNPNFLNGSLVDLRTFNRLVKGTAVPIPGITTDLYGNLRSDTVPCPGAFEFASLTYDFEPEALINPVADNCYMPAQTELVVRLRNSGVNAYNYGGAEVLNLTYQVNGGTPVTCAVQQTVPAEDTVTVHTGQMLQLPPNGTIDSLYSIRLWLTFATDPNQTNDTNQFSVISRYHPAAPDDDTVYVNYATQADITPTEGVNTWSVYSSPLAPERQSQIYWYSDPAATNLIHVGHTYSTEELREGTQYYIRQRRAMPIVRITQVEIMQAATVAGLTNPMPFWINTGRKAAVQLTNIGDATAYLEGDTLMTVSPNTSGLNAKYYTFGNVKIEPGQSLVVQFASNAATDSSVTIHDNALGSTNVNYNSNVAFVYFSKGVVEDAVPFNAVITASTNYSVKWSTLGVPDYVWSGDAIAFENNVAGVIRTAFNGNANDWVLSSADNPMTLGVTNNAWIRYVDSGCEGDVATITVEILAPPSVDLELADLILPADGCGLGEEDVTVSVRNYGVASASTLELNYNAGGTTVSELVPGGIGPHDTITYTFNGKLDLAFDSDSLVNVRVWVTAAADDPSHDNDTLFGSVRSEFTPAAPDSIATRQVQYATRDTITYMPTQGGVVPVWYDYNMNVVDTGFTHVTEILYSDGVMGMGLMVHKGKEGIVGQGTTVPNKTAFPAPYQPNNSYARQQFIYSASELAAAGLTAGNIYSISFFLDSIYNVNASTPRDSVVFGNYYISMGLVTDTVFASKTSWKDVSVVYERHPLVIYRRSSKDWVRHDLDTPFMWDGTSSLVIQVAQELSAAVTTGVQSRYTSKTNTALYKAQNSNLSPSVFEFSGQGTLNANRPNLKFNEIDGCPSPLTPYNVHLVGVPDIDAALLAMSDTLVYNSCDSIEVPVQIRNQGSQTITAVKFYYSLDGADIDSTEHVADLAAGQIGTFGLFSRMVSPGHHAVTAIVSVEGDSIWSNDTVSGGFVVRFCGGTYTIAQDSTGDYLSFGEVTDTLSAVGIDGPVTFLVANGVYNEHVVISDVDGSSETNSISIIGVGDSVVLTAETDPNTNYVLSVNGVANFSLDNMTLLSVATKVSNKNYGNVLVMQNVGRANITHNVIRVRHTVLAADKDASNFITNVALLGNVSNLNISNCTIDSGFYSVKSQGAVDNYANINISDNIISNFASGAVSLRDVQGLAIRRNDMRSGNASDSRGHIAINISQTTDTFFIERNSIYLLSNSKGAKRGIQLANIQGTLLNSAYVDNNMISTYSTDSKELSDVTVVGTTKKKISAGIIIDSSANYVKVFYNTIRVYGTNSTANSVNDLTHAVFCGTSPTNIQVMNNILSNFSRGYAYYVRSSTAVTNSNFNAYYTEATNGYMWGTTACLTLAELQAANSDDGNSLEDEPFFVSNEDLHLVKTNFVGLAQYNPDVPEDIDGKSRPPIPGATIGAHEMERLNHDMAVVRIIKPVVPANPMNIETDSLKVVAQFYNNGRSTEPVVTWYAYIEGHESETSSETRTFTNYTPGTSITDSVMLPTIMGLIDTQTVHVVITCENDTALANNELTTPVYLAPAFNLQATKVDITYPTTPQGCSMQQTPVTITLKNTGNKPFEVGQNVKIGYHTKIKTPANLVIPTMTDTVEEYYTFTTPLLVNSTIDVTFDSLANLYPTDTALNLKVQLKGWCHFQFDIIPTNDTTSFTEKNSYYTPAPPVGRDTIFPYGTWGEVMASQENSRPVRWYRDSTDESFYHPTQYNASCKWSNTPQYFSDSTYYLNCLSDKSCPSAFSEVQVHVAPRIPNDMAFVEVLAPLGNRVYMENDTVRVRISNFGTSPQSNFPVYYELKQGNTLVQTVSETVNATVAAGQEYVYTFDSLLIIGTPLAAKNYTLTVWTDLETDGTRRNDTIRNSYTFSSLPVNRYNTFQPPQPDAEDTKWDITRLSWNSIELDLTPLNRSYTNLAEYPTPEYPVIHVTRGTTDTLVLQVTPLNPTDQAARCRAWVTIDFDRSGVMNDNSECEERVVNSEPFYDDSIFRALVTIPECASYGYQRMRVNVTPYNTVQTGEIMTGHVIDFLLFVDENPPTKDLAIAGIVEPRSYLIRDNDPHEVSFRILNRGAQPLTSVDFHYSFVGDTIDTTASGVLHWTGNLAPGHGEIVTLPMHNFCFGTTTLTIWHELAGDVDSTNNMLTFEYHRFRTIYLSYFENFDSLDYWYAPTGYNDYTHNYWELGEPNKTRLDTAFSGTRAWVTDLNNTISTGKKGNISYLYSPIINIAQIRADTIAFRLRRNLTNGSTLHLEFYNFEGKWVKMIPPDTILTWHNDIENQVFTGTTSNAGDHYTYYTFSTQATRVNGDFPQRLQFRFVYTTPMDNKPNYGEGCAIDDFWLGRARRNQDAGVIAITKPVMPKYGQTIHPEVVVYNYGTDTIRQVTIGYTHHGIHLPRVSTYSSLAIAPDHTDTIELSVPFTVTSDFPDTFQIKAYSEMMDDIFRDNDSCERSFVLYPLDNDISAEAILSPVSFVIAGDTSVTVTLRLRNAGLNPIPTARASYFINGVNRVDEDVDFTSLLGRPLNSMEYFNYTFHERIHAAMGLMNLSVFIKSDSNEYIYNDTVRRRIEGITSVSDLAAASIIVDTTSVSYVRFGLVIENRGARGLNNFEVGYWIDNDSSTMVHETYYRDVPLAALSTGFYLFDSVQPVRSAPYNYVNAFVHIDNDNNPANDTTSEFAERLLDIEVSKVLVEENASNDCRVFLELSNIGNLALVDRQLRLRATVNGNDLSVNVRRRIEPGQTVHLEFDRTIPKSPTRYYEGSGRILDIPNEANPDNNQTSLVEVVNYMEGIPTVNGGQFVLEQNYPNPFTRQTTIPFSLPSAAHVRLFVMDAMGHIVFRDEQVCQSGNHSFTLDMDAYPAGIYFYGIEVDGQRQMRKMILK